MQIYPGINRNRMSLMACSHASTRHSKLKSTANRQVTQGHEQSTRHIIDNLLCNFEVELELACHNFIKLESKLKFERHNVGDQICESQCLKVRLKSRWRLRLNCMHTVLCSTNLISIQIQGQEGAATTHQDWTPEFAPSRRPGRALWLCGPSSCPSRSYFLHTASGRPLQGSRIEDGRPNGGLTPPRAHQQSHVLPPGLPSSEHQILKLKEIVNLGVENIRDLKFWHVFFTVRKSRMCPILIIFDPSQEGYLLISIISNSELIAKRWRSTVPAPGPVRVSPMWQPRWA